MREEINTFDLGTFKNIFGTLFLVSTKLETIGNKFLGELTTKQWFLLATITTFFEEPPTISEAAIKVGLSHQNVKQVALRLQEKEFVTIEKDKKDNRVSRILVTRKAFNYELKSRKKNEKFIEELFKDINDSEAKLCLKILLKLSENIDSIKIAKK
ncbi:helix-turn-helix domain-containing protein [Bacillus chungangensis]|uniref:DNA-binding MarR family transcriptional regulator n=1 Tax=Bacillus chungangensis TaxID=587633 RepID=A0ABT9WUW2_9BACI|nr:hypothetical protein [Bacillus chungangensis]MDQ0176999.1 DNA-binding MarR family transcriptional regulator [Bacillus chungangensis]